MIYRNNEKPAEEVLKETSSDKPFFTFMLITFHRDDHISWKDIGIRGMPQNDSVSVFDTSWIMAKDKWEAIQFGFQGLKTRFPKVKTMKIEDVKVVGHEDFGWFTHHTFNRTQLAGLYVDGRFIAQKFFTSPDKYEAASSLPVQFNKLALITKQDLDNFQEMNILTAPYVFVDTSK